MFERGQLPRSSFPLIAAALLLFVLTSESALSGPAKVIISEPRDLSASPGNGYIELSWNAPSQGAASVRGYNVYRGMKKDGLILIETVGPDQLSYTDGEIVNTIEYHYMVTAYNLVEEGPPSGIVSEAGDGTPPSVSIDWPQDGAFLRGGKLRVSWFGSDSGSGIEHYDLNIGGENRELPSSTTSHTFSDVPDGYISITLGATDRAGNRGEGKANVIMDNVPPELEIISPSAGGFYQGPDLVAEWECSDDLSGIDRTILNLDMDGPIDVGKDRAFVLENLSEGEHWLRLSVRDRSNNEFYQETYFFIDRTPPEIRVRDRSDVILTNMSEIVLNVEVRDDLDRSPGLMLMVNGGDWVVQEEGGSSTVKYLVEGMNHVTLKAYDAAGNEREAKLKVIRDSFPPVIDLLGIHEGRRINTSVPVLTWSIEDPAGTGVSSAFLWIDNGLKIRIDPNGNLSAPVLSEGEHTITISAYDPAGNEGKLVRRIVIDTIPPKITGHDPPTGIIHGLEVLRIDFSERVSPSASSIYSPSISGSVIWNADHALFIPEGAVPMGVTITFIIRAVDLAGNAMPEGNISFMTSDLGRLTGRIVTVDGRPIPGAEVLLDNGRLAMTDDDGYFRMEDSFGDRVLYITKRGYQATMRRTVILPGRNIDIGVIQLEKDGSSDEGIPKGFVIAGAALLSLLMMAAAVALLVISLKRDRWED